MEIFSWYHLAYLGTLEGWPDNRTCSKPLDAPSSELQEGS